MCSPLSTSRYGPQNKQEQQQQQQSSIASNHVGLSILLLTEYYHYVLDKQKKKPNRKLPYPSILDSNLAANFITPIK